MNLTEFNRGIALLSLNVLQDWIGRLIFVFIRIRAIFSHVVSIMSFDPVCANSSYLFIYLFMAGTLDPN